MLSMQHNEAREVRDRNGVSPEDMIPGTEIMRESEEYDITTLSKNGFV